MSLAEQFKDWLGVEAVPAAKKGTFVGFRIGFVDLESFGLNGSVHAIICGCVADAFGRVTTITRRDRRYYTGDPLDDSKLAEAIRDEWERYDILVGWNSGGFDLPFLNARLLRAGRRPIRSDVMHIDLMWRYGGKSRWSARMGRRSLDNISKAFKTPHVKEPLDWEMWERARSGDGKAEKLIISHCEADVLATRDVFAYSKPLIQNIHR